MALQCGTLRPTSANRPSTPPPRPASLPRTTPSAPSSPTSASSKCPIRASTPCPRSSSRRRSNPPSSNFVDIAGLVAGASKGEGLGNQFLANIRETDAIVNVVRCFDDENVVHVNGKVDPIADIETIVTELALADLGTVESHPPRKQKGRPFRRQGRDQNWSPC